MLHYVKSTLSSIYYIKDMMYYTLYIVQCTMYTIQCRITLYNVQCIVYMRIRCQVKYIIKYTSISTLMS